MLTRHSALALYRGDTALVRNELPTYRLAPVYRAPDLKQLPLTRTLAALPLPAWITSKLAWLLNYFHPAALPAQIPTPAERLQHFRQAQESEDAPAIEIEDETLDRILEAFTKNDFFTLGLLYCELFHALDAMGFYTRINKLPLAIQENFVSFINEHPQLTDPPRDAEVFTALQAHQGQWILLNKTFPQSHRDSQKVLTLFLQQNVLLPLQLEYAEWFAANVIVPLFGNNASKATRALRNAVYTGPQTPDQLIETLAVRKELYPATAADLNGEFITQTRRSQLQLRLVQAQRTHPFKSSLSPRLLLQRVLGSLWASQLTEESDLWPELAADCFDPAQAPALLESVLDALNSAFEDHLLDLRGDSLNAVDPAVLHRMVWAQRLQKDASKIPFFLILHGANHYRFNPDSQRLEPAWCPVDSDVALSNRMTPNAKTNAHLVEHRVPDFPPMSDPWECVAREIVPPDYSIHSFNEYALWMVVTQQALYDVFWFFRGNQVFPIKPRWNLGQVYYSPNGKWSIGEERFGDIMIPMDKTTHKPKYELGSVIIEPDGRLQQIPLNIEGNTPSFSHDGNWLIVRAKNGPLYIVDHTGKTSTLEITDEIEFVHHSPNSQWAWLQSKTRPGRCWLLRPNGTCTEYELGTHTDKLYFSPDGVWMLVYSEQAGAYQMFNANGSVLVENPELLRYCSGVRHGWV